MAFSNPSSRLLAALLLSVFRFSAIAADLEIPTQFQKTLALLTPGGYTFICDFRSDLQPGATNEAIDFNTLVGLGDQQVLKKICSMFSIRGEIIGGKVIYLFSDYDPQSDKGAIAKSLDTVKYRTDELKNKNFDEWLQETMGSLQLLWLPSTVDQIDKHILDCKIGSTKAGAFLETLASVVKGFGVNYVQFTTRPEFGKSGGEGTGVKIELLRLRTIR